jgi:hypothetical protein
LTALYNVGKTLFRTKQDNNFAARLVESAVYNITLCKIFVAVSGIVFAEVRGNLNSQYHYLAQFFWLICRRRKKRQVYCAGTVRLVIIKFPVFSIKNSVLPVKDCSKNPSSEDWSEKPDLRQAGNCNRLFRQGCKSNKS